MIENINFFTIFFCNQHAGGCSWGIIPTGVGKRRAAVVILVSRS